jgi:hypothetical protein
MIMDLRKKVRIIAIAMETKLSEIRMILSGK